MTVDWHIHKAAIWRPRTHTLRAVTHIDTIGLEDLKQIDVQKRLLLENTVNFVNGAAVNNVLMWGARGTGKSSLVKALLNKFADRGLRIVEVDRDDLVDLAEIVDEIRELSYRFIIFCDDLSFAEGETSYKALKSVLDGSIESPPDNIALYATSNRRHLLPEHSSDNQDVAIVNGELHYGDLVEEKLSLADRFGLWVSFYPFSWEEYFGLIDHYFAEYKGDMLAVREEARQFALSRATHSGRTAKQFYKHFMAAL
ncbi:ATP-binding protein [Aurantivibrio plasticivorans]